jgi:hypothetical protein
MSWTRDGSAPVDASTSPGINNSPGKQRLGSGDMYMAPGMIRL